MAKRIVVEFAGETANLDRAFSKVKSGVAETDRTLRSQVQSLGSNFGAMGSTITSALTSPQAAVLGLGAAVGKFVQQGVSDFTRLGEQTRKLAEATGASTREASGFIAIGDDFNVTADQLQSSFFKLEKGIGAGTVELDKFGAQVVTNKQGGVDLTSTVMSIADAYQATTDPAQRAALLTEAFGKAGADMIPIIQNGGQAIQDMFAAADETHQILDPEDVQRAEDFRLAMDNLGDSMKGLGMVAGEALTPLLTDIANALAGTVGLMEKIDTLGGTIQKSSDDIDHAGFGGFLDRIKNKLLGWDEATDKVAQATDNLGHVITGMAGPLQTVGAAINSHNAKADKMAEFWKDYDKEAKEVTKTLKAQEKATKDAAQAQIDLRDAQFGVRSANMAVTDSQRQVAEAQKAYNDLLATGGIDLEKVKSAQQELIRTQKDVERATMDVADAQKAVNEALQPATFKERLDNSRDQAQAQNDLTIAQLDAKDAQRAYSDLVYAGTASQDELTRAWVRADDAVRAVHDAEDRLNQTQVAANDLAQKGTTNTQAYKDAVQILTEKQAVLKSATDGQNTAQAELNAAQVAGKDYTTNLDAASRNLAAAKFDLEQKTWGAQKAQLALRDAVRATSGEVWNLWDRVVGLNEDLAKTPTIFGGAPARGGGGGAGIARTFLPRASGGPVTAGMGYMVGEAGPEMFVPGRSGTIVPNGGGGSAIVINFNGVVGDRAAAAREIQRLLLEEQRKSGGLGFN